MRSIKTPPVQAVPLFILDPDQLTAWQNAQPAHVQTWLNQRGFEAKPGQTCLVPAADGGLHTLVTGVESGYEGRWTLARLALLAKQGEFYLADSSDPSGQTLAKDLSLEAAIGWYLAFYDGKTALGAKPSKAKPDLLLPDSLKAQAVQAALDAVCLTRRLISLPANRMRPGDLALACEHALENTNQTGQLSVGQIRGADLLSNNFPAIYAVGRAAEEQADQTDAQQALAQPRLIEAKWRPGLVSKDQPLPKIAIVGKGVCFDTGGLDLKSASNMRLMKKDMGGAAQSLALASLIIAHELPAEVNLLIPAVENNINGQAFRPGDIIASRKGLSIEIGNTDAEGRLILADALTYASESDPDLIIDMATLTGAARVALGPDLPALFTNSDELAAAIQQGSALTGDPTWRLPLHQPYASALKSNFADCNNIGEAMPLAGAITAALFLEKFISCDTPWAHLDMMGYNTRARPGRPIGGEAMGLLALFDGLRRFLKV